MPDLRTVEDIAAAVRTGDGSAVEVLEAHEQRAAGPAGRGAIITPIWDDARERAKRLDNLEAGQLAALALAGVPLTVPAGDSSAAGALRAAGAVIVGTTDRPEVAIAAGVAAGGLSLLHGPARTHAGIVALRPTVGRVPVTGRLLDVTRPLVIGPIAGALEDLRLLLSVIAVPDGIDRQVRALGVPRAASTERLLVGWSTGRAGGGEVAESLAGIAADLGPLCASVTALPEVFADPRHPLRVFDSVDLVVRPGPVAAQADLDVSRLGLPVVSVAAGQCTLQVIAAPWKEHLALDLAAVLEDLQSQRL